MHFKFKTIQTNLFISYSLFFIIILLIIEFTFYSFFSNYIIDKVSKDQIQLCTSMQNSLDSELTKLDTASMNIIYSNLIKDKFSDYLSDDFSAQTRRYSTSRSIIDIIMSIIGPYQNVNQVNMYDLNGNMVGTGIFNGESHIDVKKEPWYNKTMALDGFRYVHIPKYEKLLNSNYLFNNHQFISLTRIYKNSNYEKLGIIQVIQDCDILFKYVNDIKSKNNLIHIYIINSDGYCVYPYKTQTLSDANYYRKIIKDKALSQLKIHEIRNTRTKSEEVMTYNTSSYSGWTIIVVDSKNNIFSSLNNFTKWFLILCVIVIIATLFVSYAVSKSVTVPLRKLGQALRAMTINDLSSDPKHIETPYNSLDEIDILNETFNAMNTKLSKSLKELLEAKSEETNAKLLALQSQMNPHFLYNNLTNISIMAEENMNSEIVSLCSDMSYMLRYISTENKNGIEMYSEIDYTEKFFNCMKIRYEENLKYSIDIPDKMLKITVPKLIIQPLVENSIKYGLNSQPPWNISVNGYMDDKKWYIYVSDSGTGFSKELISKFENIMDEINDFSNIPELKIGGMGLLNICIRLKLFYKEDAVFTIKNLKNGGALVIIGGSII